MKLGRGQWVPEYTVFLSSANDALVLRDRVDGLIHNAVVPVLKNTGTNVRFLLDRWPKTTPRRLEETETIDDEFVERAVSSNLVLTLIVERLGSGTKKEIEAVVESETDIALLWFVELDEDPDNDAGKFLHELQDEEILRFQKAGRPETNGSWEAIVAVLLEAVLESLRPKPEAYREER